MTPAPSPGQVCAARAYALTALPPPAADQAAPAPTHWPAVLAAAATGVAAAMNVGKMPLALPLMRDELGLRG